MLSAGAGAGSIVGAARGSRSSCELHLLEVVEVDVRVAERVHEVARLEPVTYAIIAVSSA